MNAKRARLGYLFLVVVCLSLNTHGSETDRIAGIRTNTPAVHAFIHAQIVVEPGREVHNGTLVIRDGLIEAVKENSAVKITMQFNLYHYN
jgi:hypothetical protein